MSLLRSSIKTVLMAQSIKSIPTLSNKRSIKRWVSPTLRELRKRQLKLGPQEPQPRSGFIEWNYRSELFAFSKRLHEDFQLPLLQTAFTNRSYILREEKRQRDLGIEETDMQMEDNKKFADIGQQLIREYVQAFMKHSLPNVPEEGQKSFTTFLLSENTLADIALHLGVKDLVLSAEYPPTEDTLATTLQAIVGALEQSSGAERAFHFIRDFICTQLNQRDLLELWQIENPENLLKQVCTERQLPEPEPRLIGDCAKNTVLAAYHVGIYSNKKMIGKGFGEDLNTAIQTASLDALQIIFGIQDNIAPFNFKLNVEAKKEKIAAK